MNNKTKYVKVTLEIVMQIPTETGDEQLAAALPETLCEVLPALIRRPEDARVVKVEASAGAVAA